MFEFAKIGLLVSMAIMLPSRTVFAQSAAIEYKTVAEAYNALQQRKDLQKSTDAHGWLSFSNDHSPSIWTFAPATDPAYPAVVKRNISIAATASTSRWPSSAKLQRRPANSWWSASKP